MRSSFRCVQWLSVLGLLACRANPGGSPRTDPEAQTTKAAPKPLATESAQAATPLPSAARPLQGAGRGAAADQAEWTAGIVDKKGASAGVARLVGLRSAAHAGFDRVVFEFEGAAIPGLHVEYIDRPVRRCGSGDVTEISGDGWLSVTLEPSSAHTDAGEPTVTPRERLADLPILREIEMTCDFEAQVTVVMGVHRPNRYRVLTLHSPSRVVVDIRH